jgi:excisionase family DNA binding protein
VSERLLTTREVAIILRVSTETVLRWHRNGKLPFAIRLPGGELRFPEQRLYDWLAARATPGQGVLTASTDAALAASQSALLSSVPLTATDDDKE